MSGPLPTLAATAALGRMSSKFSLSTRTLTPVTFGELARVRHPLIFVALDEALPAQHAQLGALLRRVLEIRGSGRAIDQRAAASGEARRAQHLERIAPGKICHGHPPSDVAPCRRTAREGGYRRCCALKLPERPRFTGMRGSWIADVENLQLRVAGRTPPLHRVARRARRSAPWPAVTASSPCRWPRRLRPRPTMVNSRTSPSSVSAFTVAPKCTSSRGSLLHVHRDGAVQPLREIAQVALDLGELGLVEILTGRFELGVLRHAAPRTWPRSCASPSGVT